MIRFSTPNGRALSYLPSHGHLMLELMGCIASSAAGSSIQSLSKLTGVIPVDALPAAHSALTAKSQDLDTKLALAKEQKKLAASAAALIHETQDDNKEQAEEESPRISSRAYPLLMLLAAALREEQPVVWELQ